MDWFDGEIAQAIELSRSNKAIFVVAVLGDDKLSKEFEELFNESDVSSKLNSEDFVAVKLVADSLSHNQFQEIFPFAPSPSIHFIGLNGKTIKLFDESIESDTFLTEIDAIVSRHSDLVITNRQSSQLNGDNTNESQSTGVNESPENRFGAGPNDNAEFIEKMNQIKQKKAAEKVLRGQILARIADDRAETAALGQNKITDSSSASSTKPKLEQRRRDVTRILFRFPDGDVHVEGFEPTAPLSEVHDYILNDRKVPYSKFVFALPYPKTVFSDQDYSVSLNELNLSPSAVLVVCPLPTVPDDNYFVQLCSFAVKSANYVFNYFWTLLFGSTNDAITEPEDEVRERRNRNQASPKKEIRVEKQGNVRQYKDNSSDDDDDDNKFWNGNSTQQL